MASIRETRKKLMPVVIALAVLDLACIGYLFSPAGRTRSARQKEYQQLHQQLLAKQQEVLPTRGMDQKLVQASKDITGFYDQRFPAEYSAVAEELGKVATDTGIHLSGVKYDEKDAPIEDLHKLHDGGFAVRRLPPRSEIHQRAGARQDVLPHRRNHPG